MKCKKCGFENLEGVSKCGECKTLLVKKTKSCPKCATKNNLEAKKCKKCDFYFNKSSKKSLIFNLVISLLVVGILFLLIFFDKSNIVKDIQFVLKIIAILFILFLLISSFIFGRKNEVDYTIPEMKITNNNIERMKKISKFMFVVLGIVILVFGMYFLLKYIK